MDIPSPKSLWKPLAVAAALSFVYAATLIKLGLDWWTDENYSHGLLIPFVILFILWSERKALRSAPQRPSFAWGGALILLALAALWAGTAGAELYVQRMSLVIMLCGIVLYFFGAQLLRLTVVPLLLLLLAIPIPSIIFNKIAFPLQLFASSCAVWAMRLFGIPVLRLGNVIELMPRGAREIKRLEVVEACSGIRSLMTLVTLAVLFAYFTRPKSNTPGGKRSLRGLLSSYAFWRVVLIVAAAVPIAIVANALRVSGTGILAHYYGTQVADGFFHSFSGWVVYIVAFVLLFAVGWMLDHAHSLVKSKWARENGKEKVDEVSEAPAAVVSAVTAKGLE